MQKQMDISELGRIVQGSEDGTAIITVLLILMLLTFVAITSTNTTITEKAVVRSDSIFQRDFYFAESAALEGIQKLANETSLDELIAKRIKVGISKNDGLLISANSASPENDMANLDANGDGIIDSNDLTDVSELNAKTYRRVVQLPIGTGDSLSLGSSRLYSYSSYGLTESQGGRALIKIGYKRRF